MSKLFFHKDHSLLYGRGVLASQDFEFQINPPALLALTFLIGTLFQSTNLSCILSGVQYCTYCSLPILSILKKVFKYLFPSLEDTITIRSGGQVTFKK
jgi:hypothetical protein